jgi:pimeloyl-ACP methyl ester carboxylesterase
MDTVILVHGLYMTGAELGFLRHRLARVHGFRTRIFRYRSVGASLAENAARLEAFVAASEGPRVHLLGHSLGGVVLVQMLQASPPTIAGRVVCLGSPLRGSSLARAYARVPLGRHLVGRSMNDVLREGALPAWRGERELGVIAGATPVGFGALLGVVPGPSDGTVSVEETRLAGVTDHLVLPVCHFSMLFSPQVADQAAAFFRAGRFRHEARAAA